MSSPVKDPLPSILSYQDNPSKPVLPSCNIPNNAESSFLNPAETRSICSYIVEASSFLFSLVTPLFQYIHSLWSALWERNNFHLPLPQKESPTNTMHLSADLALESTGADDSHPPLPQEESSTNTMHWDADLTSESISADDLHSSLSQDQSSTNTMYSDSDLTSESISADEPHSSSPQDQSSIKTMYSDSDLTSESISADEPHSSSPQDQFSTNTNYSGADLTSESISASTDDPHSSLPQEESSIKAINSDTDLTSESTTDTVVSAEETDKKNRLMQEYLACTAFIETAPFWPTTRAATIIAIDGLMMPPHLITVPNPCSYQEIKTLKNQVKDQLQSSLLSLSLTQASTAILTVILLSDREAKDDEGRDASINLWQNTLTFFPDDRYRKVGDTFISLSGDDIRNTILSPHCLDNLQNIPYIDTLIAHLKGEVNKSSSDPVLSADWMPL